MAKIPYHVKEIRMGRCQLCGTYDRCLSLHICGKREGEWYCRECFHKVEVPNYAYQLCECGVGWI